jgi:membrane fusion protein, macrolide-specific efflux system
LGIRGNILVEYIRKLLKKYSFKKYFVFILAVLASFILYAKIFKKENPVTFLTEDVRLSTIQKVVNATGEVGAIDLVSIGAQVSGKIEKIYVELGQDVKSGDLMAQIDSTTEQNNIDIDLAKLESYKSQLVAARTSLKVAKNQYERGVKLFANNAMSKEALENLESAFETAKSNVVQFESNIKQVQITLKTDNQNLSYTKIVSPIDGTVVSLPAKEGQTLNANMSTPTIAQVANLDSVEILMEISEGDIINIKEGMNVKYTILGDSDTVYNTNIKSIDPALTLLTDNTYTGVVGSDEAIYYYGKLIVPNNDRKLKIGMTTQSVIYIAVANNTVTIPSISVFEMDNKKSVRVLKLDNEVENREVEIGISDGINVEVKNGVKVGEKVIISELSSEEISKQVKSVKSPRGL